MDYFLFDVQEGYCDYYASAMVVMLRSLGIPARLVVGYTPGEYIVPPMEAQAQTVPGKYLVLERNAHAWVEVYFPTYGWIQFEPTASEPLLTRPASMADLLPQTTVTPIADDLDEFDDLRNQRDPNACPTLPPLSSGLQRWFERNGLQLIVALGVLIAAIAGILFYRRRQAAFFGAADLIPRLFVWLGIWARRLPHPVARELHGDGARRRVRKQSARRRPRVVATRHSLCGAALRQAIARRGGNPHGLGRMASATTGSLEEMGDGVRRRRTERSATRISPAGEGRRTARLRRPQRLKLTAGVIHRRGILTRPDFEELLEGRDRVASGR